MGAEGLAAFAHRRAGGGAALCVVSIHNARDQRVTHHIGAGEARDGDAFHPFEHALSGLIDAERVLKRVKGISVTRFTSADVVRHPLVARIVDAYDAQRSATTGAPVRKRS